MLDAQTSVSAATTRVARQMLGMQQLGPHGLSEQWLLGFCGDLHWGLIAGALGQESLRFRTADGRPLYAAFCATRLELAPTGPLLGEALEIRSDLAAAGGARLGSRHRFLHRGREIGALRMLSTFVAHDETGSNRRIVRARPARNCALPMAEPDLMALDARARDTSRALRGRTVPLAGAQRIEPCHGLDFNAVGLLYFPSLTRLVETAARSTAPIRVRELVYLGNLDAGAAVHVLRAGRETLVARDDGSLIARAVEERASASRPDQPAPA